MESAAQLCDGILDDLQAPDLVGSVADCPANSTASFPSLDERRRLGHAASGGSARRRAPGV